MLREKLVPTMLTLHVPNPDEEKKLRQVFIFTLLCGAPIGLMKALKAFVKPFEAPERTENKIHLNFYFNATFRNARDGKC